MKIANLFFYLFTICLLLAVCCGCFLRFRSEVLEMSIGNGSYEAENPPSETSGLEKLLDEGSALLSDELM